MASLELIQSGDGAEEARFGATRLFRYVFDPATPAFEGPKPCWHPVGTLGERVSVSLRIGEPLAVHAMRERPGGFGERDQDAAATREGMVRSAWRNGRGPARKPGPREAT